MHRAYRNGAVHAFSRQVTGHVVSGSSDNPAASARNLLVSRCCYEVGERIFCLGTPQTGGHGRPLWLDLVRPPAPPRISRTGPIADDFYKLDSFDVAQWAFDDSLECDHCGGLGFDQVSCRRKVLTKVGLLPSKSQIQGSRWLQSNFRQNMR